MLRHFPAVFPQRVGALPSNAVLWLMLPGGSQVFNPETPALVSEQEGSWMLEG